MASPSYTTRTLTIPAGGSVETYRDATFLSCLSAQAPFLVAMDGGAATTFEAGLTYTPPDGVRSVELRNPTASDNTVTLAFGRGAIQDSRLTLGGSISAQITAADTLTTPAPVSAADGAATQAAAANANRAELILANDGGGTVYVAGSSGAAAGQGIPLAPGAAMVLATTAAAWIRNDTGAAVTVCVAEIERGS